MISALIIILQISSGLTIQQLLLPIAVTITGMILSYIFIIPVMQNKIDNLINSNTSTQTLLNKISEESNKVKSDISLLSKNDIDQTKLIDELFQKEEKNTEKFSQMIQKNTEAITKLESTLHNLNEYTKKLEQFFETIVREMNKK
jgi:uncharacterized membrane protein YhiD involved in acid resistance